MKTWMIRHQNLTFTRPIPEAELIEKIESGQVLPTDEIASNSGYWFSISEIDEVIRHFGENIRLQSMIPIGAETTSSTNTAVIDEKLKHNLISKVNSTHTTVHIATKTKPKPKRKIEAEKAPSDVRSRIIFGCILISIFCGTLWALWSGSQ